MISKIQLRTRISMLLVGFMIGLLLSGLTAFPLEWEVRTLARFLGASDSATIETTTGLVQWIVRVRTGLIDTNARHPFLSYGTDWLAFGHIVIALAFIGPLRDPIRNIWIIEWGILACVLVIPLALICGPIRHIPLYWQLVDCSFGVIGIMPLLLARKYILQLSRTEKR